MLTSSLKLKLKRCLFFLLLSTSTLSCKGDIGDECIADVQCSPGQMCDLVSTGGYCTIMACEEGECPGSSVCVTFENEDRYCMATCGGNGDCREGYRCDQELGPEPFCRQE